MDFLLLGESFGIAFEKPLLFERKGRSVWRRRDRAAATHLNLRL
jgi:hypothetical protein